MIRLTRACLTVVLLGCTVGYSQETTVVPKAAATDLAALPKIDTPTRDRIRESIQKGISFLVADQNENGSWGSATKTKGLNIFAPIPGAHHAFRAGTTTLCISALLETASKDDAQAQQAIERAETWLLKHLPGLRRATGDAIYNVWGHCYAIQALTRLHKRHEGNAEKQQQLVQLIQQQFERLQRYESVDGGWGYYDFRYQANQPTSSSISFVNGSVLVALAEAREIGVTPPTRMVNRALDALRRQMKPDHSYLYGEYLKDRPAREINRPGGSLGRSQCCNAALRLWEEASITNDVIQDWLVRLYLRNGWLDIGRKRPIPHESWMQVAGYFYFLRSLLRWYRFGTIADGIESSAGTVLGEANARPSRKEWMLVGLSALRLPPPLRNCVRVDDAPSMPVETRPTPSSFARVSVAMEILKSMEALKLSVRPKGYRTIRIGRVLGIVLRAGLRHRSSGLGCGEAGVLGFGD